MSLVDVVDLLPVLFLFVLFGIGRLGLRFLVVFRRLDDVIDT